jgi:hypothetical protein
LLKHYESDQILFYTKLIFSGGFIMKNKSMILSCVMVFCLVAGVFSASAQYSMTMESFKDGGTASDQFDKLEYVNIDIKLDTPTTGIVAGCAFTLTYPTNMLQEPSTTTEGVPTSTDIQSSQLLMTINGVEEHIYRVNSTTGQILFSGAAIDTDGGSGFHYQDATLFTVRFQVKSDAPDGTATFELKQTVLDNADAGWNNEGVPVLVGAIGNDVTSCSGWAYPNTTCVDGYGGNLSDDFPVLLDNYSTNPTLTINVGVCDAYCQWKADNGYNSPDIGLKTDDYDHDGTTNEQERIAGSDPTDQSQPIPASSLTNVDVTDPSTWPANYSALTDFRVANLDIDGDGKALPDTDAVLLYRFLINKGMGFDVYDDAALIDKAVGSGAKRDTAAKIKAYIDAIDEKVYDVDGSGIPAMDTDAVLIYRYSLNKTMGFDVYDDAALIEDAVGTPCGPCDAPGIKAYIDLLFPD